MALNFPSNPATNTEYTFGTKTWVYNGFAWDLKTNATNLLEALKTVDGIDSGLDADLLDGSSSEYYTDIVARLGFTPYDATNPSGYTSNTGDVTLTGTQTLTNKTLTSPDVNGGTIDSAVIGGSTPAAVTGTDVIATGNLKSLNSINDEGGEIFLAKPQTNNSIAGTGVTIDIYQNKIRIFEQGSPNRGAYIDLTAAGNGVGSNLLDGGTLYTAGSGLSLNAGAFAVDSTVLRTGGSYADPAWLTSVNYSKLTGSVPTWNQNTTGSAGSVAWGGITAKPTTLSGYGITDAAAASHTHSYLPLSGGTGTGNWYTSANVGSSQIHLRSDSLENYTSTSDTGAVVVNYYGYNSGASYFRDFIVFDGKGSEKFKVVGSSGAVTIAGNQVLHAGNYTGFNGYIRALGFPSESNNWDTLGNSYLNSLIQVIPNNFASTTNGPTSASYTYGTLLNLNSGSSGRAQVYISHSGNDLIFRGGWNDSSWQTWNRVLTNQNYTGYSPSLTGSGASGTWGISVTGSAGSVSGITLTNSANGINPDNVTQNQIGYNTSVSLFGQTDGGLYSSAYGSSWIHQIYGDFRTGQIAVRGKNSGTWQAWRVVLDSGNYTDYAYSKAQIDTMIGNLEAALAAINGV